MIPPNKEIRFEVTTHCNYNCILCPNYRLKRKKEIMSLRMFKDLFDKIIDETDQYNSLSFAGLGEPLIDSLLEAKILYVKTKKPDFNIPMVTNGSLLTVQRFKDLQTMGIDTVRISFHGGTPSAYGTIHGKFGYFNQILDVIEKISKIKGKTRVTVTMAVIKDRNDYSIEDWKKLWEDIDLDLIEIWKAHNWNQTLRFRELKPERMPTCGRVFDGPLQIQVDGTINLCCFDYDGQLQVGDLKTQSLSKIFESDIYKSICARHTTGNFKGSKLICEFCDQRNKDKSDAIIYSSKYDLEDRVNRVSTTYDLIKEEAQ